MRSMTGIMASVAGATAVFMSSGATAATIAAVAQPIAAHSTATPDAWMMLSLLGPAQVVALGGDAAASQAQGNAPPPPSPPPVPVRPRVDAGITGILVWWVLIAIELASTGHSRAANSPG